MSDIAFIFHAKLAEIFKQIGINFTPDKLFHKITSKNYSFVEIMPVQKSGKEAGMLYLIGLNPGEGTGNDSIQDDQYYGHYKIMPSELYSFPGSYSAVPRNKRGIDLEVMFNLGHVDNNELVNGNNLHEVTFFEAEGNFVTLGNLLEDKDINLRTPDVQVTTLDYNNRVFGRLHSMYNTSQYGQVAAFFAISMLKNNYDAGLINALLEFAEIPNFVI